jgi:hypothetical protein
MTDAKGGYYSAEDADSEGEEGLFYIWTIQELQSIIGEEDTQFIQNIFNLTPEGNFKDEASGQSTGNNIFHLKTPISNSKDLKKISQIREKIFHVREKRIHPLKDDKILTDWNGLMIAAMAKAGVAFQDNVLIESAEKSAKFIFNNLMDKNGRLQKRYRKGKSGLDAHLDDYAFFVWGLLELYEATFKIEYLKNA